MCEKNFSLQRLTFYSPEYLLGSRGAESQTGWFPAAGGQRHGSSGGTEVEEEKEDKE